MTEAAGRSWTSPSLSPPRAPFRRRGSAADPATSYRASPATPTVLISSDNSAILLYRLLSGLPGLRLELSQDPHTRKARRRRRKPAFFGLLRLRLRGDLLRPDHLLNTAHLIYLISLRVVGNFQISFFTLQVGMDPSPSGLHSQL
jgi:hypothetical protein